MSSRPAPTSTLAVVRNWLVYGVSSVASRLIGFLLLPVYTRVLSPEEYGVRAMVTVGADVVGMLFSLGLGIAMARFYAGERDARRPIAVSTGLFTGAAVLGAGVLVAIAVSPWLAGLVLGDRIYAPYLRLGLVSLYALNVFELGLVALRVRQRAGTVALLSLATLVTTVTLNLIFVVAFRLGVAGILYGEIITYGAFALALGAATLRDFGAGFSLGMARRMIVFGAPLTLMPFAWLVINRADMLFLAHTFSLSQVGVYSLAVQYAQVLLVAVIYPFRDVWDINQFLVDSTAEGRRFYQRVFQLVVATVIGAALVGALLADEIIRLLAPAPFHGASSVVPILLASHVLTGFTLFFNSAFLVRDRTGILGAIAFGAAAVDIVANALLVPRFGATGAASARLIALATSAGTTFVLMRRVWPHRVHVGAIVKAVGAGVALFVLGRVVPPMSPIVNVPFDMALVLAFATLMLAWRVVDRADVMQASHRLRGWLTRRAPPVVPAR